MTIYGTVRGRDGAAKPDPKRFARRGREKGRRAHTPWLLCSECGRRMSSIERRVQDASGAWTSTNAPACPDNCGAAPVEWNPILACTRRYIETVYLLDGDAGVDALVDSHDPVLFPGTSPGELALVRMYWRPKWRDRMEVRPESPTRLFG